MIQKKPLISIDILRALAALGVFSYHQHIGTFIARYMGVKAIGQADNFGAEYAVPLFFLISGFCIHLSNLKYIKSNSRLPLKEYYKRRFLRIYPPYLAALIFALVVNYFTYSVSPPLMDIVVHVFLLQGITVKYFNTINVVLWTITIEIAFYIIYPAFYYFRLKYSLNKALLFSAFISSISIIYFSVKPAISLPGHYFALNLWFAWCCGAYLADMATLNFAALKKPVFAGLYLIIAIAYIAMHYLPDKPEIIYYNMHILIWAGPLVLLVSKENWLQNHNNLVMQAITKIGLSSYSLYLLHEPLITLKNYLSHRFLPAQLQLFGMCIGIIIIPAICWYSFKYIEKPFTARKKTNAATA